MRATLIIILFLFSAQNQAFVKCVNADGHVQYGDECTLSNTVKKESMYTEDTYDPEADNQAQINNRELEKRTQQSAYERKQREAYYRRMNTNQNSYEPKSSSSSSSRKSYRTEWDDRRHCIYSCKKDPGCIAGC